MTVRQKSIELNRETNFLEEGEPAALSAACVRAMGPIDLLVVDQDVAHRLPLVRGQEVDHGQLPLDGGQVALPIHLRRVDHQRVVGLLARPDRVRVEGPEVSGPSHGGEIVGPTDFLPIPDQDCAATVVIHVGRIRLFLEDHAGDRELAPAEVLDRELHHHLALRLPDVLVDRGVGHDLDEVGLPPEGRLVELRLIEARLVVAGRLRRRAHRGDLDGPGVRERPVLLVGRVAAEQEVADDRHGEHRRHEAPHGFLPF